MPKLMAAKTSTPTETSIIVESSLAGASASSLVMLAMEVTSAGTVRICAVGILAGAGAG